MIGRWCAQLDGYFKPFGADQFVWADVSLTLQGQFEDAICASARAGVTHVQVGVVELLGDVADGGLRDARLLGAERMRAD